MVEREVLMEQQQQTTVPAQPRASARRVPGLEGVSGKLRVEVEGKSPRVFAIHDGLIEPAEANGQVDAVIVFDDESCVEELLTGKLNPIVAGLQGRLRISGNMGLAAKVLLELQGQATSFGRRPVGEA
jgi:putative sterol carrier protein